MANYNPLTTIYTPAPSCFGLTALGNSPIPQAYIAYSCLPHQGPPGPSIPSFYSPGICPSGYSSACPIESTSIFTTTNPYYPDITNLPEITLGPGEFGHKCCPSGYQCSISDFAPYYCTNLFLLPTPTTVPYWDYVSSEEMVVFISTTVIGSGQWTEASAFAVCVKWKSDDLSLFPPAVAATLTPTGEATGSNGLQATSTAIAASLNSVPKSIKIISIALISSFFINFV